jgi:hypothetical protein
VDWIRTLAGLLILLMVLAMLFAPIDVPYQSETLGRLYPAQVWELVRNDDGSLTSAFHDYRLGKSREYSAFQFDRGDQIQMHFADLSEQLNQGDTVLHIVSNVLEEQLLRVRNQLALQRAQLQLDFAGQKPETIRRLEEELVLAREALNLQHINYERALGLFESGVVPQAILDTAYNARQMAIIQLDVAQRRLEEDQAGERPEQIAYTRVLIETLEREEAFLLNKANQYKLLSPVKGRAFFEPLTKSLRVEDTSAWVLMLPLRLRDLPFLGEDAWVEPLWPGVDGKARTRWPILRSKVQGSMAYIQGEEVVYLRAELNELPEDAMIQGLVRCKVHLGSVRPAAYLKYALSN